MALDKRLRVKEVLTTGEVAKICNVSPRTATKWFDAGQLGGYRIPGSKDRRIPRQQLIQFMGAHGIPTDELCSEHQILVYDGDYDPDSVYQPLAEQNYGLKHTANLIEIGIMLERLHPAILILNIDLSDVATNDILSLCEDKAMKGVKLIAVSRSRTTSRDSDRGRRLIEKGFYEMLGPDLSGSELLNVVEAILQ